MEVAGVQRVDRGQQLRASVEGTEPDESPALVDDRRQCGPLGRGGARAAKLAPW